MHNFASRGVHLRLSISGEDKMKAHPQTASPRSSDRVLSLWLLALVVLHLLPIWLFEYFPTQDGPIHLSNARVLLEYDNPACSVLPEYYRLNTGVGPNWFSLLSLAGLLKLFSPEIAEKVFLSAYVLALVGSAYFAILGISRRNRFLLLLVFPFVFNHFVFLGFYNFIFGLPFVFLFLGIVLRSGSRLGWGEASLLALASVLAFFVHPLTMLAAWFMALPPLAAKVILVDPEDEEGGKAPQGRSINSLLRRAMPIGLAALPSAGLFLHYWLTHSGSSAVRESFSRLVRNAVGLGSIITHSRWEAVPSLVLSASFLVIGIGVLRRDALKGKRASAVGLLMAIVAMFALYFVAPASAGGGNWINARLLLYPFLAAVLWFACYRFSRREKSVIIVFVSLVTLALLGFHLQSVSSLSAEVEQSLDCGADVEANSTVLPVSFSRRGRDEIGAPLSWKTASFSHFAGYVAADRCMVQFDNYAAWKGYFPVSWRSGLSPRAHLVPDGFDSDHPALGIQEYEKQTGGRVDYALLRDLRPEDLQNQEVVDLLDQLSRGFEEVCREGSVNETYLYRRIDPGTDRPMQD